MIFVARKLFCTIADFGERIRIANAFTAFVWWMLTQDRAALGGGPGRRDRAGSRSVAASQRLPHLPAGNLPFAIRVNGRRPHSDASQRERETFRLSDCDHWASNR